MGELLVLENKNYKRNIYKLCVSMYYCTGVSGQSWCEGLAGLDACVRFTT